MTAVQQDTYTQPALFPDAAVIGPGHPRPWPLDEDTADDIEAETHVSPDQLALDQDEEPQP